MVSDNRDGFIIYQKTGQDDAFNVKLTRIGPDGSTQVLYDRPIIDPAEPMAAIISMRTDADGNLYLIEMPAGKPGAVLRRLHDDEGLEDVLDIGTVSHRRPYRISRTGYGYPAHGGWFDPHQGIVVLGYHIGERRHALYRITTAPWQPQYPALHDQGAFAQMLQTFAGGQASISDNGIITVQIGNQRYQLIADDTVEAADSGRGQGIHELTDRNGDNLPDFLLVFPDQKQQLLYLLPPA